MWKGVFDCILFRSSHMGSCPLEGSGSTYSHNTSDKHSNLSKCWRASCKVADPAEDRTLITASNVGATNKPHRMNAGAAHQSWAFIRRTQQQSSISFVLKLGSFFQQTLLLFSLSMANQCIWIASIHAYTNVLHWICSRFNIFNLMFCAHSIFTGLASQASHKPEWCWPLFSHGKEKGWLKSLQRVSAAEYILLSFGSPLKNEQQWDVSASISQRKIWNSFYTTWLWKDAVSNGWIQNSIRAQAQQH